MSNARIRLPNQIRRGEAFEVRTLVTHDMESGQRRDAQGQVIPRKILNSFICTFNGQEVVKMDLAPAISANPYISFWMVANEAGSLEFKWVDDDGTSITHQQRITVG
jgi:sulfur-oxidizing protein SoxZ